MYDRKEYFRKRYLEKRAEILKKHADYRGRNREALKEKALIYYHTHKEEIKKKTKEYRRTHRANSNASYEVKAAHSKVAYALKTGKLTREPCGECGARVAHAHHDNYAIPLAVVWLCRLCHAKLHRSSGTYDKCNASEI